MAIWATLAVVAEAGAGTANGDQQTRCHLPGLIYTPETARFIDDPDGPLPGIDGGDGAVVA